MPHKKARKHRRGRDKRKERIAVFIARNQQSHLSAWILKEFNAKCVERFLEPIIDKESILCLDGAKYYETFASEYEISQHPLIRLDNQRVIGKALYIQKNMNSDISD
ncbi:MAG: hypothetical protein ACTS73_07485 [Arsenophonus sp. NEOnobi-MAG3]